MFKEGGSCSWRWVAVLPQQSTPRGFSPRPASAASRSLTASACGRRVDRQTFLIFRLSRFQKKCRAQGPVWTPDAWGLLLKCPPARPHRLCLYLVPLAALKGPISISLLLPTSLSEQWCFTWVLASKSPFRPTFLRLLQLYWDIAGMGGA